MHAFRKPWPVVVSALALAGCSHPKPIDPSKTPTFGSKPSLSTAEGFVVGRWQRHVDLSTARPGILSTFNSKQQQEIEFVTGGVLRETIDGHKVVGKWTSSGGGIDLQVDSVDGRSPEIVRQDKARYDQEIALDNERRHTFGRALAPGYHALADWGLEMRYHALELATEVNRLELYQDNRQLYWPHSVGQNHAAFMGTVLFVREPVTSHA